MRGFGGAVNRLSIMIVSNRVGCALRDADSPLVLGASSQAR
jgi:hypothetical protein